MSILNAKLSDVIDGLDDENVLIVLLLAYALKRNDTSLIKRIESYGRLPRGVAQETRPDLDLDLLRRVKAVCPADESETWGRALTKCAMHGNPDRLSAFQDLMRIRVAS